MQHLKGASLGKALALPANLRLGWRGLPATNTLVGKLFTKVIKVVFTLLGPLVMPNAPSVFFWLNFVRENKTGRRFKNQEILHI